MRENTLIAQTFDTNTLRLTGDPMPVAEHVGSIRATGVFSVSPSGTLAYRAASSATGCTTG